MDCIHFDNNDCKDITTEIYCYFGEDSQKCKTKLDQLSKNILVIVAEYLSFFQLMALSNSNKKIKVKLDNF